MTRLLPTPFQPHNQGMTQPFDPKPKDPNNGNSHSFLSPPFFRNSEHELYPSQTRIFLTKHEQLCLNTTQPRFTQSIHNKYPLSRSLSFPFAPHRTHHLHQTTEQNRHQNPQPNPSQANPSRKHLHIGTISNKPRGRRKRAAKVQAGCERDATTMSGEKREDCVTLV